MTPPPTNLRRPDPLPLRTEATAPRTPPSNPDQRLAVPPPSAAPRLTLDVGLGSVFDAIPLPPRPICCSGAAPFTGSALSPSLVHGALALSFLVGGLNDGNCPGQRTALLLLQHKVQARKW